jgi:hypothetical protein
VRGLRCLLLPAYCDGLSRVLGGEAHQAAGVTAGPAYGSHLRGAVGQIRARWSCGRERGLPKGARGQRGRGLSEHRSVGPAGHPRRRCGAAALLRKPASTHRACAVPPPPAPWRRAPAGRWGGAAGPPTLRLNPRVRLRGRSDKCSLKNVVTQMEG